MSDSVRPHRQHPLGSSVPGILQARTLEWVAISFSSAWKWKVKVKSLSRVRLLETPWTAAYQAPPPMGFSRQEYWSGVPLPSQLDGTSGKETPCQCRKVKRESEVAQLCRTLSDPMDCSLPGSSVRGIFPGKSTKGQSTEGTSNYTIFFFFFF